MSTQLVKKVFDQLLLGEVDSVRIAFKSYKERETVRTMFYRERAKFKEVDSFHADTLLITRYKDEDQFYLIITTIGDDTSWLNNIVAVKDGKQVKMELEGMQ